MSPWKMSACHIVSVASIVHVPVPLYSECNHSGTEHIPPFTLIHHILVHHSSYSFHTITHEIQLNIAGLQQYQVDMPSFVFSRTKKRGFWKARGFSLQWRNDKTEQQAKIKQKAFVLACFPLSLDHLGFLQCVCLISTLQSCSTKSTGR